MTRERVLSRTSHSTLLARGKGMCTWGLGTVLTYLGYGLDAGWTRSMLRSKI